MPSQWMNEMQGQGHEASSASEPRPNRRAEQTERKGDRGAPEDLYDGEQSENDRIRAQARKISLIISIVVSIIAVAVGYYYSKSRVPIKPLRGVSAVVVISSEINRVYDYVSTPDFRTEWHLSSVEVSGPAIDHSAVVGEMFAEEFRVAAKDITVDWNVLDRQFPTSTTTNFAEFVVEGTATIQHDTSSLKQHWREIFRLRATKHQFAGTDQVQVEFEILIDGKDAKDMDSKWKKSLTKAIKASLTNIKDRVEEDTRANPSPQKLKEENKKKRLEKSQKEALQPETPTKKDQKSKKEKKDKKKGTK